MSLEEDFQKARREGDSRQGFLNIIAYRGLPEYVASLRYKRKIKNHNHSKLRGTTKSEILCTRNAKAFLCIF